MSNSEGGSAEHQELPAWLAAGEVSDECLGPAGDLSAHWAVPHMPRILWVHLSYYFFGCSIY